MTIRRRLALLMLGLAVILTRARLRAQCARRQRAASRCPDADPLMPQRSGVDPFDVDLGLAMARGALQHAARHGGVDSEVVRA